MAHFVPQLLGGSLADVGSPEFNESERQLFEIVAGVERLRRLSARLLDDETKESFRNSNASSAQIASYRWGTFASHHEAAVAYAMLVCDAFTKETDAPEWLHALCLNDDDLGFEIPPEILQRESLTPEARALYYKSALERIRPVNGEAQILIAHLEREYRAAIAPQMPNAPAWSARDTLPEGARKMADYIDAHPGCFGKDVAAAVNTTEDNFRATFIKKLRPLGYSNAGNKAGYFPPKKPR